MEPTSFPGLLTFLMSGYGKIVINEVENGFLYSVSCDFQKFFNVSMKMLVKMLLIMKQFSHILLTANENFATHKSIFVKVPLLCLFTLFIYLR